MPVSLFSLPSRIGRWRFECLASFWSLLRQVRRPPLHPRGTCARTGFVRCMGLLRLMDFLMDFLAGHANANPPMGFTVFPPCGLGPTALGT